MELVGGTAARRISPVSGQVHPMQLPSAPSAGAQAARRPIRPVPTSSGPHIISSDVTREVENGQVVWRVRCGDLINRDRCVTVFVDDGQVVIASPPGETARMTASQIGQLKAVLNEAAKLAER